MHLLRVALFPVCLTVSSFGLVLAESKASEDYYPLIVEYVNKVDNIYDGSWAYSYTIQDKLEQESRSIRRSPDLPPLERDVLLSVDGQPPSSEELDEHRQELQRRVRRQQRSENRRDSDEDELDERERFLAMIIQDSIHVLNQEEGLLHLGFMATEDDRQEIFEHLAGELIIDTKQGFIKELRVRSTGPFTPFFLSRVEQAYLSVRFSLHEGVPMQAALTWKLTGTAFFFRDLNADREVSWFDFDKI